MSSDEDYLDSLLAQMQDAEPDPNSAISNINAIKEAELLRQKEEEERLALEALSEIESVTENVESVSASDDVLMPDEIADFDVDSVSNEDISENLDDLSVDVSFAGMEMTEETPEEIPEEPQKESLEKISEELLEETTEDIVEEAGEEIINDDTAQAEEAADVSMKKADADMAMLSQDDIEKLINAASNIEEPGEKEGELSDVDSLEALGIFDKDFDSENLETNAQVSEEMAEINDLIATAENSEIGGDSDEDLLSLLSMEQSKLQAQEDAENLNEEENEEEKSVEKKKKKSKKDKAKKKKSEATDEIDIDQLEALEEEKKPSLIKRIFAFMTASDEDEVPEIEGERELSLEELAAMSEFEDVPGENKEILKDMDAEGEEDGKKKKKKKGKKDKKGKKGKGGEEAEEGSEEEGEESGKKKEKKAKKEKVKKEPEPDNSKPLNKKNVIKIAILAATLLAAILLAIVFIPKSIMQKDARKAYYAGDYEKAYVTFFGEEKLSESDEIIFNRSKILLKINHKYEAYQAYNRMNMQPQALDQLLQAVDNYENWILVAESYSAVSEFEETYKKIIDALGTYGLNESQAREILALQTDLEYSLKVQSIATGSEYIDPNQPMPEPIDVEAQLLLDEMSETEIIYEDLLPEEELP